MAQLWRYLTKVYHLPRRLQAVRDTRLYPNIPTPTVSAALFLGAVLRLPSFRQISKDSARAGWRRLLKLDGPISDDVLAYVVERYRLEDWREVLVSTNHTLKRNRAFESAKMNGLLVVSIDANEQFNSRHRCCEGCCQRKVRVRNHAGQEVEIDEFYHRMVYACLHGPQFSVVLDVEPIRPREDESAAALRMLGRMRRLRAVRRLCWGVVSVLKQERFDVYQESSTLAAAQSAERFDSDGRPIALREVGDLTLTEDGQQPVRVVLAEEEWIQTARIAGRKVSKSMTSHWRWIATPELDSYPKQTIWRIGHSRWAIENHVFNQLTQYYHLEHCPHHHPVAIIARLLILVLGFNLFEVFVWLHGKLWQSGKVGLLELAIGLDRSLEYPDQLAPLWSG